MDKSAIKCHNIYSNTKTKKKKILGGLFMCYYQTHFDIFNIIQDDGTKVYRLHFKGHHFANVVQKSTRNWEMEIKSVQNILTFKSKKACVQYALEFIETQAPRPTAKECI